MLSSNFLDLMLSLLLVLSLHQQSVESAGLQKISERATCQEFTCPSASGTFPISPESCSPVYYVCSNWVPYENSCPDGYVFDPAAKRCVEIGLASCSPTTTPSGTTQCPTSSTVTTSPTSTTSTTRPTTTSTTTPSTTTTTTTTTTSTESTSTSTPSTTTSTTESTTSSTQPTTTSSTSTTSATESTTSSTEPTTTPSATSTTLTYSTIQSTSSTSGGFVCPGTGFYPYDGYCSQNYWACTDSGQAHLLKCPGNLVFNPNTSNCVDASTMPQCQATTPHILNQVLLIQTGKS